MTDEVPHYSPPIGNLTEGVVATLNERGARYGDFANHARIADDLMNIMETACGSGPSGKPTEPGEPWNALTPHARQALRVIADKIARILNGDPNYADNWHDIQGYAKLVEDRLQGAPE